VVIAVDNDAPGKAAAARAAARFRAEGRRVQFAMPDRPGDDFNDVLRTRRNG
jgi:DNA primase